ARVQVSTDAGNSWRDVYTQTGNNSGWPIETTFNTRTISLSDLEWGPIKRITSTATALPALRFSNGLSVSGSPRADGQHWHRGEQAAGEAGERFPQARRPDADSRARQGVVP